MKLSVIVAAAGKGLRMGGNLPKQYISIEAKPILQHTLERMKEVPADETLLVVSPDDDLYTSVPGHQCCRVIMGGTSRADSVLNGLRAIEGEADDWIMVHDGVRPCVRKEDVLRLIETVGDDSVGGLLAVPVVETVKRSGDDDRVNGTEDRAGLWLAQTPQLFRFGLLREALEDAVKSGFEITDEASAIERAGYRPLIVEGSRDNIKVTTTADLQLAAVYLAQQEGNAGQ